ncbi:hypothetical protein NFI95_05660 [Acetobacteraceae bacterium KSS8]|uniref:Uncharacterized protein n=1 Tax=Endosaccharibacter trunci TaxID=2812733 RepID=A0ABT1W4X3_9PROT|nr:hypothetical protein [Acetobacteraceae bacterium KSS8]
MTAAGRLWRRAPAWRFCLISSFGLFALAAMFPPTLPDWRSLAPGKGATPHFVAEASKEAANGIFSMPSMGETRTGSIPFAGRSLPLPPGNWLQVGYATLPNGVQQQVLARVANHRLEQMILATATGVFGGPAGPVGVPPQCADPNRIAGAIVPETPDQNPLQHECWAIVPADMRKLAGQGQDSPWPRALDRLGDLGFSVPDQMLAAEFVRSTDRGWQTTIVLLPAKGGSAAARTAWATRYQTELHKGFDPP